MDYKIIADSCCDMSPELKKRLGITVIPLSMTLGEAHFMDDETLNLSEFMQEMKNCTGKIGSASPSPLLYKEAITGNHTSFVVTLSSKLSGSYNSAILGRALAMEDGNADAIIFDSKSASAGEVLLVLKIHKLIQSGFHKTKIAENIEDCIQNMKTYFVLDNIDNLQKNGRLSKVTGKLISALNIKPVMGADGDGNIALFSYARSRKQIVDKLVNMIEKSGRDTTGESMVITHCNNPELADKLFNAIDRQYRFEEIIVLPTGGLSSMYANDKGIVIAF